MKGLVGFVAAMVVAVGLAGSASAETLRILAYEGYADKDWVEAFEKESGADVSVAYAGSPEEMIAKMQGSRGPTTIWSRSIRASSSVMPIWGSSSRWTRRS